MTTEKKRLRIGVLFGGRSGEHEVSLISAASVISRARSRKIRSGAHRHHQGRPLARRNRGAQNAAAALGEVLRTGERVMLSADPNVAALVPASNSRADALHVDVVFPVLHGTFGEDGTVQGLLDLAGLPYVGSACWAPPSAWTRTCRSDCSCRPSCRWAISSRFRARNGKNRAPKFCATIRKKFRFPVFVKPATLGSSVGMTKAHDAKELAAAMDFAAEFAQKIMVERAIRGREIELSVLGNEDPKASIPGEIVPHREFYDYAAKYLEEGTRLLIPAKLTKAQVKKFQEYAVRAFRTLDCWAWPAWIFSSRTAPGKSC